MRRHATASSTRSKARKPSGQGSAPAGRIRLTILLATVAAFLLVPAAQAFAETVTVTVGGTGSGEVNSAEGLHAFAPESFPAVYTGEPPIECSYRAPIQARKCGR